MDMAVTDRSRNLLLRDFLDRVSESSIFESSVEKGNLLQSSIELGKAAEAIESLKLSEVLSVQEAQDIISKLSVETTTSDGPEQEVVLEKLLNDLISFLVQVKKLTFHQLMERPFDTPVDRVSRFLKLLKFDLL